MAASTVGSSRNSASLSDRSSVSSSKSSTSRRKAGYSHPLYQSLDTRNGNPQLSSEDDHDQISRFSSCSTSPGSSTDSLNIISLSTTLRNKTSSLSIGVARSSSNRSSSSAGNTSLRYADDHYPLITSVTSAHSNTVVEMAHAYNTYIRALNCCYNYASTISTEQVPDFLFFNQTLFNILSIHLKLEQQHILPFLHKPTPRARGAVEQLGGAILINENETFVDAFHCWATYIHAPSTCKSYSSNVIKSLMSTFAPLLVQHLHDEISNLNTLVGDGVLIPNHLARIWLKITDSMMDNLDLDTDVALLVGCQDKDFTINGQRAEHVYPRLSLATTTMVKTWHARKYNGAWKFCSSNFSGRRRLIQS